MVTVSACSGDFSFSPARASPPEGRPRGASRKRPSEKWDGGGARALVAAPHPRQGCGAVFKQRFGDRLQFQYLRFGEARHTVISRPP